MSSQFAIDDARFSRFHVKITAVSTGGVFCDGYILGIIAPALVVYGRHHELSALWTGLLGASALIGLFVGSSIFGLVTDRVGRQTMYMADLMVFVVASALQFFVTDVGWLIALRFVLGIAMGADYAISPTLLAEFAPRRHRGWMLSSISAVWTLGYVLSFVVGYFLASVGPGAWRWMLASSAVPALIVALLRIGTPESPRWLVRRGRHEQALHVVRTYIDPSATMADLADEDHGTSSYRALFGKGLRMRVLFAGLFWFCQVVPYFAVFTFLPVVLGALDIEGDLAQSVVVNGFLLVGALVGMALVNRMNRRPFLLGTFLLLTVVTAGIGLWTDATAAWVVALFGLFAFASSAAQALASVYPAELFPTHVRALGVGVATAVSRIGAAVGTFLLPIGVTALGVHTTTLIAAVVLLVGLVASVAWAPETRHLTLDQAAAVDTTPQ